ncbi:MAG: ATP-binding protein [Deltaproteobacteria bacterium]|nr:ATP-binding protein [Deltaproteobacteria bacterium]
MRRDAEKTLVDWYKRKVRKPLVIRGARQVGKSTLVSNFAKRQGLSLLEINCEQHSHLDAVFKTFDLDKIIQELEFIARKKIGGDNSLLFLDEIQATPHALAALRYFYEKKPQLPVVAAGSLLEFALNDHDYSMPVGRVEYLHLGPMNFMEFLDAQDERALLDYLRTYSRGIAPSTVAHDKLLYHLRNYLLVGGMPEAISSFIEDQSTNGVVSAVHFSILETYRDDFGKYGSKKDLPLIHKAFDYLPTAVGRRVKYINIDPNSRSGPLKRAVDLLEYARLMCRVCHSSASGIPLAATVNDRVFKPLWLDVGLMNAACGISSIRHDQFLERRFVNEGSMAEQFIGQHLLYQQSPAKRPSLYYWVRQGRSSNAEVDYVCQVGTVIVPIEVKAGKSGSLKSLQQFAYAKKSPLAIRFDLNQPSSVHVKHKIRVGTKNQEVAYQLISLPLYMVDCMPTVVSALI